MPVRRSILIAASLTLPILATEVQGQRPPDDDRRARARAQSAQRQFESYRRRQLPVTHGRGGSSECDVRLGRFCYWHDDADDLPKEPERIARAREAFVRSLDSLAAAHPDESWIVGQRVRYLVESKRAGDAVSAARACTAAAWWCAALAGFAEHALGDFAQADAAFAKALAAMPESQRCAWTDLREILPDGFQKEYRAVPCAARDSVNARVWWLADPRWTSAGNDLRTELYARLTMGELVRQARSAHDMAWGDDMAELMLRYGWPTAWSRGWESATDPTRISVIGHEPSPSFEFVPSADALRAPLRAGPDGWSPLAPRPITRYAPLYARHVRELEPQVAWFARGDSAVIVVGYDVRVAADTVFTRDSVEAAVALSHGTSDLAVARSLDSRRHGSLALSTPRDTTLVSVEVADSGVRALARARFSVGPPADSAVSDLLLFDAENGELPESFDAAATRALGTLSVSRAAPFGVYWELYGQLARASEVSYEITVERQSPGLLRRFAERVRLAQPVRPVQLSFGDTRRPDAASAARSLLVDVSHIPAGRYTLTLRVVAAQGAAAASREIEVR